MREQVDEWMTFVGIIVGIVIGAIYTLFRVKHRGDVNRKNVTHFGAGTLEQDMQSSIEQAKAQAHKRVDTVD